MAIRVRTRQHEDLARCARLLERTHVLDGYPVHWPDDPSRWLSPPGTLRAWVAEDDRAVLGHVLLHAVATGGAEWESAIGLRANALGAISRLFSDSDRRGAGIGGCLLRTASTEALARGLVPVLDVVETRTNAIEFYERQGWRRVLTKPWSGMSVSAHSADVLSAHSDGVAASAPTCSCAPRAA